MSADEAYAVACPDCRQAKGQRCVYLWPKNVNPDFIHYASAATQARAALTGTPTKRPHNGRLVRIADLRTRRARREIAKAQAEANPAASPARMAAARAEREFERREYVQLRIWFAAHGSIFTEIHSGDAHHRLVSGTG